MYLAGHLIGLSPAIIHFVVYWGRGNKFISCLFSNFTHIPPFLFGKYINALPYILSAYLGPVYMKEGAPM